jgi:hypothetical protein
VAIPRKQEPVELLILQEVHPPVLQLVQKVKRVLIPQAVRRAKALLQL